MKSKFMSRAIELARLAADKGEVPVGAVVVKDGKITDFDIDEGLAMKKPFDKDRLEMATKLNF